MAQYTAVAEAFRLSEKRVGLLRKVILKKASSGKIDYSGKETGIKRTAKVVAKKR